MRVNYAPLYTGMKLASGYGKAEYGLYLGLIAAGVDVTVVGEVDVTLHTFAREHRQLQPERPALADISIVTGRPALGATMQPLPLTRRWCYTMSESTKLPAKMIADMNRYCERILVPCGELVELYRENGVRVPVDDIGTGVEIGMPTYRQRREPGQGEDFIWLTYSYGDLRKGADRAIVAFKQLFGNDRRHKLIVKARDGHDDTWLAGLVDDQIEVIGGTLPESTWHQLLQRAHCFIFPSRGEGFGLPPREAVLAGVPTVTTRWLGLADANHWGITIGHTLRPLPMGNDMNLEGGLWAEPDHADLLAKMRWVYENYDLALKVTRHGHDYLLRHSSYVQMGLKVKRLLEECA